MKRSKEYIVEKLCAIYAVEQDEIFKKRGSKWATLARHAVIRWMHHYGYRIEEIAEHLGRSESMVYQVLKEMRYRGKFNL